MKFNLLRTQIIRAHTITRALWRPRLLLMLLISSALMLLLVPMILRQVGDYLIVSDQLRPVDAIVPLAGDPARVRYAARMFNEGHHAQCFLVTNMAHVWRDPTNVYSTRTSREAGEYGVPLERIFVAGQPVRTTYEEALVIRDFAEEHGWQDIIVITSPSHTRRARIIFRDVFFESSVTVIIQPVEEHWYTPDSWWRRESGRHETLAEYAKLILYLLGYR
jgi:uncharacterized SAM-binding protein YcdF (DUF218 family)